MYLKSLEVHGFKSFPDKTVLNFNPGTTIIVGPNGSGKSNITDAMRWVLGELSSKNLRGSKMEDVIFSGADGVRPMGYAEVSVTFDNSGKEKTVNSEYDEITVTRRYYRAGDSEYYINRKQVRLRDIYELFMNTGVGREGYSIIGQGKIAEIISKKSEDRRSIFEESAGISKYRYRKQESQKKLAETEANMERVSDIQTEVESRLGPLERDSKKARRYLELYDEKKRLDVSLWLYDMKGSREELEKTETDTEMSSHELEIAEDTLRTVEAQIERHFELSGENKEASQRNLDRINEKRKDASKLENDARLLENDAFHAREKKADEEELIRAAEAAIEAEKKKAEEMTSELADIKAAIENSRENEKTVSEERESYIRSRDEKDKLISDLFEERQRVESEIGDLSVRLNVLKNTVSSRSEQKAETEQQLKQYGEQRAELEKSRADTSRTVEKYGEQIGGEKEALEKVTASLAEVTENLAAAARERVSRTATADSLESRVAALMRMAEHFDGYNNSVRFVMNEAKEGRLSGIHGPLSRIIKVKNEHSVAVETALGPALQNIVTSDEEAAKAAIRALKNAGAGRATFYPITTVKGVKRGQETESAAGCRGFIGFADELVDCDPKYRDIISSVLGRVTVFDNIDNASDMARARSFKVRAVTLDGQQINVGGSFTGGSVRRDSGILTRDSQIEKLKKELAAEKKLLEKASSDEEKLEAERSKLALERVDREEKIRLLESLGSAEKTQLGEIDAKLDFAKSVIEKLTGELSDSEGNKEEYEAQIADLQKQIDEKTAEVSRINAERAERAGERGDFDLSADEAAERLSAARIETARLEKDLQNTEAAISDSGVRVEEREAEILQRREEIANLKKQISDNADRTKEIMSETEHSDAELRELEEKQRELDAQSDKLEAEIADLRKKEKEQTSKKELAFVAHTKNENKLEKLRESIDKMTARLWDEYELTFSGAVELESSEGWEPVDETNRRKVNSRFNELRTEIKSLGNVNVGAIEEYAQTKERYDSIKRQMDDLLESRRELEGIISSIEDDMKRMFTEAFRAISKNFTEVFRDLFGGGNAELSLTDPEDVLGSGIEISAAPPGKTIKNLSLLSGGEQAFIAIALMFALIKFNPSPFCIFDEIEAALDEVNVTRFANYVKRFSDDMQIIMITHRRGTMEVADTLYGVTMPRKGISKVFTLDINNTLENEKFVG